MKYLSIVLVALFLTSCIPLRIAPTIKEDKIMVGKKFKRGLPKRYAFIFEDPKDANEFYNYVNTKFELDHQDVESNVPFSIDDETFYFSFYETEIATKTINLVPIAIDAKLESKGLTPLLESAHSSRVGHWYLAITVNDNNYNDCLKEEYVKHQKIVSYLQKMRVEYLNTSNYLDALFRK